MKVEKIFTRSIIRIFWICFIPVLILVYVLLTFAINWNNSSLKMGAIAGGLVMFMVYVLPNLFMGYHHWKASKGKSRSIAGKEVILKGNKINIRLSLTEIRIIEEYTTHSRSPIQFKFWKMHVRDNCFCISNVVNAKNTFDRYFWKSIQSQQVVWPKIKECS